MDADAVPSPPVVVEYALTADEVIPVLRWQIWRVGRIRSGLMVASLGILLGVALLAFTTVRVLAGLYLIAADAFMTLLYGWIVLAGPTRAWQKVSAENMTRTVAFSDEGVHVQTKLSDAVNRWEVYPVIIELSDVYVLQIGQSRRHTIVPKRAFRLESDERRFRALAERHTDARLVPGL